MTFAFGNRNIVVATIAVGLGILMLLIQPARAATLSWNGAVGATWDVTSNNWSGATVGTPWDSTNGPGDQANFMTSGASAEAAGQDLYAYAIDFATGVSGCTIDGGTINTGYYTGSLGAIGMNLSAVGTNTITSTLALQNNAEYIVMTNTSPNPGAMLNLAGLVTSSGTVYTNIGGNTPNSSTGSVLALAGSADSFNLFEETNGQHGTIYIPSGGSVSANVLFVANYCANVTNGNLSCGTMLINNSTAGHQIFTGSGTITTANWISDHLGPIDLGTTVTMPPGLPQTFTGSLNVSGQFTVGKLVTLPGPGGTQGAGSTINQNGGSVVLTGGADLVTMGYMTLPGQNSAATYNLNTGFLSIPNAALEMGVGVTGGATALSTFSQTGGSANINGLWMGQTQSNGAQNGNCAISVTGGTLNLGAGGIQSNGTGTKSVTLGNATLGALAPWTASVPITLGGNTTIDATGGNITLAGALSGGGGLTAVGTGTLLLPAINTYTGPTSVSGGTVEVDGSLTSAVTVGSGGMLTGTGSLPSIDMNPPGGHVSPGDPGTGQLVVTNSATLAGNLDIVASGGTVTSLSVGGNLVLSSATLNVTGTLTPGTYVIASYGGTLGGDMDFATTNLPAGVSVNYGTPNEITLSVVPEPGTLALLAAGVVGIVCLRRRIKARTR